MEEAESYIIAGFVIPATRIYKISVVATGQYQMLLNDGMGLSGGGGGGLKKDINTSSKKLSIFAGRFRTKLRARTA